VVKNITEQLRMRARYEGKGRTKKYVAMIGASEIGRMAGEIGRMGEQVVMLGPVVRIRGEWTEDKVAQAVEEVKLSEIEPDMIVIAGPGNSQVKHGRTEVRGYGPEIKVVHTREGRIRKEFHPTEPARNSLKEKERLVNMVEDMVRGIREEYKSSEIVYLGLLPRHVEKCCEEKGHMQGEDIVIMHGARREFDKIVRERIGKLVDFTEWYEILGFEEEISVKEVRDRKMLKG
jgi:hypothetical protein